MLINIFKSLIGLNPKLEFKPQYKEFKHTNKNWFVVLVEDLDSFRSDVIDYHLSIGFDCGVILSKYAINKFNFDYTKLIDEKKIFFVHYPSISTLSSFEIVSEFCDRFLRRHWVLVLEQNDFFFYPSSKSRNIKDLVGFLKSQNQTTVHGIILYFDNKNGENFKSVAERDILYDDIYQYYSSDDISLHAVEVKNNGILISRDRPMLIYWRPRLRLSVVIGDIEKKIRIQPFRLQNIKHRLKHPSLTCAIVKNDKIAEDAAKRARTVVSNELEDVGLINRGTWF